MPNPNAIMPPVLSFELDVYNPQKLMGTLGNIMTTISNLLPCPNHQVKEPLNRYFSWQFCFNSL